MNAKKNPPVRAGSIFCGLLDKTSLTILDFTVNREANIGGGFSGRFLALETEYEGHVTKIFGQQYEMDL
jgi:hypothetical protein